MPHPPAAHERKLDAESTVKRNPHPNFKKVEASRPPWSEDKTFTYTKTKNPDWQYGTGSNDGGECLRHKHVEIDPYEEGRPATFNYKLLISGIVPRPIGFVSTISENGKSQNLAPFSYFNTINHDPPLFVLGFSGGYDRAKDSLTNLRATKQCTLSIISEHYLEAANACSINAPYGISEWSISGLTPAPSTMVKAPRVKEAVFSIECVLESTREFESRATKGKKTGVLAVVEGVRFWVREDAVNKERNVIDSAVLRPMARLGGISYGRLIEGVEIPRPDFEKERKESKLEGLIKEKVDG